MIKKQVYFLIVLFGLVFSFQGVYGEECPIADTWIEKGIINTWTGVSVSSSGQYQTAVANDSYIYVSDDYGNSWIEKGIINTWTGVSVSSSGQYQTAVARNDRIYISDDYGNSWTEKGTINNWIGVSVSSSGQYQTAVIKNFGGEIYISDDYGNSWTGTGQLRIWGDVSISSSGQYQTATSVRWLIIPGKIYVSDDYGNSWTRVEENCQTEIGGPCSQIKRAFRVSISSSGQYQTAIADSNYIYVSDDYGNSWIETEHLNNWSDVSVSSSGQYQTAVARNDRIYISCDYGNSWAPKESNKLWSGVSVSSSGQYQTAVVNGGYIYVSNSSLATPPTPPLPSCEDDNVLFKLFREKIPMLNLLLKQIIILKYADL